MTIESVLQDWLASFLEFLPKVISSLVIFITTLIASGFLAKWIKRVSAKKISSHETLQLISRIVRWSVLVIGFVVALDQVNFDVTGFIAGLGVAGFTIGFALQDIAKNFISGLLLLYRQPFSLGDMIEVSDFQGKVKEINVRDTVIVTLSGKEIIIPNRDVFENPIINLTKMPLRRRSVMIGLGYDEDTDQTIEVFLNSIRSIPGVEQEPEPLIRVKELGDFALMLEALFWVNQEEHDLLVVHSNVVKAIKQAAEENGINLPFPMQTILLRKMDN